MRTMRLTEKTAKRVAYPLMAAYFIWFVLAFLDERFWPVVACVGLAAGTWMGRLSEAQATRKGNGIRLE